MKRLKGLAIAASLLMLTAVAVLPAAAEMSTIYGTVNIGNQDRDGHDKKTKHSFNAPVEGDGVIVIRSTAVAAEKKEHRDKEKELKKDRTFRKVKIELNGKEVAEQRHFEKGVEELRYNVNLLASNTMKVQVKGCKECSLELSVLGNTDAGPVITPPAAPPAPPTPPPLF